MHPILGDPLRLRLLLLGWGLVGALLGVVVRPLFGVAWREALVFGLPIGLAAAPVSLSAWFWGKIVGRYIVVFAPVFLAMLGAVGWATIQGIEVPWDMFGYYTALLAVMAMCFLGIGMLISAIARTTDIAQGAAFMVWLTLLALPDRKSTRLNSRHAGSSRMPPAACTKKKVIVGVASQASTAVGCFFF